MRLSISHRNKNIGALGVLLIVLIVGSCQLTGLDRGGSSGESSVTPKARVTIAVPAGSAANGSITASEVYAAEIDQVRISVHRPGDQTNYVTKVINDADTAGNYSLEAEVPVNTLLVAEAIGINTGSDAASAVDDVIVAYGKRTIPIGTDSILISMDRYSPVLRASVRIDEGGMTLPVAAAQGRQFEATVAGYVPLSEWPDDPNGDPLDTIDLVTSTYVDGAQVPSATSITTLFHDNASGDRVSFSYPFQIVAGESATTVSFTNEYRIIPGNTLERTVTLDVMSAVTALGADGQGDGSYITLSWTNPTGTWFDGVVVTASQTETPLSVSDGTTLYNGSAAAYTHTGLSAGEGWNYAVIPYAEDSGVRAYGPVSIVSATSIDGVPPGTPPSFTVTPGTATTTSGPVSISWGAASGSPSEYRLLRKTGSLPTSYTDPGATTLYTGTGTSFADTVSATGVYYYAVYALDASGNVGSPAQASASVTLLPPPTEDYWIGGPGSYYGRLTGGQTTSRRSSYKYADTWTFSIAFGGTVTIDLESYGLYSDWFDTYLYLYDNAGNYITANDDGGYYLNSKIVIYLNPGTYKIEASHYGWYRTGSYRLNVNKDTMFLWIPLW